MMNQSETAFAASSVSENEQFRPGRNSKSGGSGTSLTKTHHVMIASVHYSLID
jgi:hypothetical protein